MNPDFINPDLYIEHKIKSTMINGKGFRAEFVTTYRFFFFFAEE